MTNDKDLEQVERRAELAVKVATLEERSLQNQHQLNHIEDVLIRHATDEEQMLRDISTSIREVKNDVDEKIDTRVELKLEPLRDELREYKIIYKVLAAVVSGLIALFALFKDYIINHFTK